MEAILDTNFIISCIRKKIDFAQQLTDLGFRIYIPREVTQELKDLNKQSTTSQDERIAINIALELISKKTFKKISLGQKKVDLGLIEKGKSGAYIATLDNGVKRAVPNRIIIHNAQKSLAIERA